MIFDHLSEELTNVIRLKIQTDKFSNLSGIETRGKLEILFLQTSPFEESKIINTFKLTFENESINAENLKWCWEQKEDETCLQIWEWGDYLFVGFLNGPTNYKVYPLTQTVSETENSFVSWNISSFKTASLADSNPLHISMRRALNEGEEEINSLGYRELFESAYS